MNDYLADSPPKTLFSISKFGYPFILIFSLFTVIFILIDFYFIAFLMLFLTLFVCFFFRDPSRTIPINPTSVVSPADGKIIDVCLLKNCEHFKGECHKISIFMSIFNVHVNRVPIEGIVKQIKYHPGKYFCASLDKASINNERNAILLETDSGLTICFVQIAGLIARRIICKIKVGDLLKKGQRFGLICFGSRLDIYLPSNISINVVKGNKVKAGSSIIGEIQDVA